MATKPVSLIVRISLIAILAVLIAILALRLMSPSTMTVENVSGSEVTDVELRFTVDNKPIEYRIDRLSPDEKQTITLSLGSGDFPLAATYRQGPYKVNCDPGISIKGRGKHVVFRISEDKYEVVTE
jgi:hypothetical protein